MTPNINLCQSHTKTYLNNTDFKLAWCRQSKFLKLSIAILLKIVFKALSNKYFNKNCIPSRCEYPGASKCKKDDSRALVKAYLNQYFDLIKQYFYLQQINDIKASCSPDTEETECLDKLQKHQDKNEAHCGQYCRNLAMYKTSKTFYTSPEYADFFNDIKKIANNEDLVALSFFTNSMLVDYPSLARKWQNVYQLLTNTTYPCNVGNLPFF